MQKGRGFTLVELLTVIAIISLLMGILIPVIQMAKKQAKAVYCISNLRQIGIALSAYALENKDFIPRALDDVKWIQVFISYLGEKSRGIEDYRKVEVFQCPSFPSTGEGSNGYYNKEQTVDYVVNAWNMDNPRLSSDGTGGNQQRNPTKLSNIKMPAMRVYMADNEAGDWRPVIRDEYDLDNVNNMNYLDVWSTTHLPASEQETTGVNGRRVAAERHRGKGCNNLFFDGHAEWLHKDENTVSYWVNKTQGNKNFFNSDLIQVQKKQ